MISYQKICFKNDIPHFGKVRSCNFRWGIHGGDIARDAAGCGLQVLMCEKNDLRSAASFAGTKRERNLG